MLAAATAADDKQGSDTVVLEVGAVLGITDHFVITSGANPRQVKTIADEIEAQVAEVADRRPIRVEGMEGRRWVLLDYGDFVAHVFREGEREFYDLDRLWADVPVVDRRDDRAESGAVESAG